MNDTQPVARINVVDNHVVPHFTVFGTRESTTRTVGRLRRSTHDPVHGVDVVDRLFGNLVTGEPNEVHPIVDLVVRIAHAILAIACTKCRWSNNALWR